jgi:beta-lactamase regulating signal transducer with metallopeptidase domain
MTAFWSAIVNAAILSALLTIGVWIALRLTPRRALNAATRYAIWWLVLLATLALPLSFVPLPHHASAPVYGQAIPLTDSEPVLSVAAPVVVSHVTLPLEIPTGPWLRPILLTWIAASLLLLLRVALGYAALYRRTARAVDAPPELRARFGADYPRTRIALSEEIDIPMAVGPFRPAILLPTKRVATMTDSDLDQICLHEATHLARRDDYTLFLQRIVEALFALHPVVRRITRQLDLEREIACDDAVARSSETARSYADCLTRMVQVCVGVRPSLAAAAFADSRSHLSRRVELLMRANRANSPRLRQRLFVLIAIALLCAAVLLAKTPLMIAFATQSPPPDAIYTFGPGDIISVTVAADTKKISGNYEIAADGDISMPIIGVENAAGLTVPALRSLITRRLDAYVNDAVVDVHLLRTSGKKYILSGDVLKPGPYPLLKGTTILDALKASGGFKAGAATRRIIVLRGQTASIPGGVRFSQAIPFNYNEAIRGVHTEQNVILQDGDVLVVPVARRQQ